MNKIFLVIQREYLTRVKKKSFIIMTLLAPVLIAGLIMIPAWIMTREDTDEKKIVVVGEGAELFIGKIPSTKAIKFEYRTDADPEIMKTNFKDEGYYGVLYISPKIAYIPNAIQLYSQKQPTLETTMHISNSIEKEIEKLSSGRILFNPPEEMKVGVKERVVVRLTKDITENLTEGLKVAGAPQIEPIELGTFMTVKLTGGDNFDIKALSTEEQVVKPVGFTEWSWDVRPLKSGRQELHLTVTVRILISGQDEQKIDWPVMDKQISVEVNPPYTFKRFIECYWQWIVATIISAIAVIPIILKLVGRTRKK